MNYSWVCLLIASSRSLRLLGTGIVSHVIYGFWVYRVGNYVSRRYDRGIVFGIYDRFSVASTRKVFGGSHKGEAMSRFKV